MDEVTLRSLFPEITDQSIAERQAAQVESKKQSLRDQIANLEAQANTLRAELEALEPVAEEATETTEEVNQG